MLAGLCRRAKLRHRGVASLAMRLRVLAFVVMPLALAACGSSGGSPESEQVRSVVHRSIAAYVNDKGSEFCSFLTDETQRKVAEHEERELGETGRTGNKFTCSEAIEKVREHASSDEIQELEHEKISVKASGGTATVTTRRSNGSATQTTLSKTPAGWLISKPSVSAG